MTLLCRCVRDRGDLYRLTLRVEGSGNGYLLSGEFQRELLVAQRKGIRSVIQNIRRAVAVIASDGAFGIRRPHAHLRMIAFRAHTVGDGAGELPRTLGRGDQYRNPDKDQHADKYPLHRCHRVLLSVSGQHEVSGSRSGIHDPCSALGASFR